MIEAEIIQESNINSILSPGTNVVLSLNEEKANIFDNETTLNIVEGVDNNLSSGSLANNMEVI